MVQGDEWPFDDGWSDSETDAHLRLTRYLREQGELDESDLDRLTKFLDSHQQAWLTLDWQEILDALQRQEQTSLWRRLDARIARPADVAAGTATRIAQGTIATTPWVMMLGAGASKPAPTNIPLVSELLAILWEKAAAVNAKSLLRIRERAEDLGITNIEDLLTAIDIAQTVSGAPRVRGLIRDLLYPTDPRRGPQRLGNRNLDQLAPMDDLRESSETLFSLLVGMMRTSPANPIHVAIADRSRRSNLTALTTNYDVCLERALGADGYWYVGVEERRQGAPILKMHGSLNWFACRNCDRVVAVQLAHIESAIEAGIYPVVSQCPSCEALAPHLIVPPIGTKSAQHPTLLAIRHEAEEAIKSAGVFCVVGYSFQETDEYILRMISRAVSDSDTQIVVFDTSAAPAARLSAFLKAHATGFTVERNVHIVQGDASETLPAFIAAWPATEVGSGGETPVALA
ncbi:MAG: SIR2 family protein [Dehalococcoidia bacterium]